jgi:superfamily I DNA and RNA helicase
VEEVGDHFEVRFAEREGVPPDIRSFASQAQELDWVSAELARLIGEEDVRREDILVVFYKPQCFDFAGLKQRVAQRLGGCEFVEPFGVSQDKRSYIFKPGCLTLSTVYGAKGYDAPVVFLVGADRFEMTREGRAAFYVASTRAKIRLYVTGVNSGESLLTEATRVANML